jgi:predicted HicB family RNase H-like nuclease
MIALHYKDFQGSVDFEDGRLVIQILHIDDLITTEIDSAAAAQGAFEELVDDYVETCKQLGKEPCKPFKGSFNVRIAPELHRQVAMAAVDSGCESMNAWVEASLAVSVERQKAKKALFNREFALRVLGREPETVVYRRVEAVRHVGHIGDRLKAAGLRPPPFFRTERSEQERVN